MRSGNRWGNNTENAFLGKQQSCMNAKFGAMLGKPKRKAPEVPGPVAFHHLPSAGLWAAHVTCAGSNVSLA
jgi:hypothetical protein